MTCTSLITDVHKVVAENLFTSNGISQALELACQCFAHPGDTIIVEEPVYHFAHAIFADNKLRMRAAGHTAGGVLDVDSLELQLRTGAVTPTLLYVVLLPPLPPSHP